jgi:hypothetical protein
MSRRRSIGAPLGALCVGACACALAKTRVRAAWSTDAAASWRSPIELDVAAPLGRVAAAFVDEAQAAVSWIGAPSGEDKRAPLLVALIDAQGRQRRRGAIARIAASRDSGMPQIAAEPGRLVAAWTDAQPSFGIRSVTVVAGA